MQAPEITVPILNGGLGNSGKAPIVKCIPWYVAGGYSLQ